MFHDEISVVRARVRLKQGLPSPGTGLAADIWRNCLRGKLLDVGLTPASPFPTSWAVLSFPQTGPESLAVKQFSLRGLSQCAMRMSLGNGVL